MGGNLKSINIHHCVPADEILQKTPHEILAASIPKTSLTFLKGKLLCAEPFVIICGISNSIE